MSQIVRRCEFGEDAGESDFDDHLASRRRPMKQAGKLESKSMVSFSPNPTCGFLVDRQLGVGDTVAVDSLLQHTCLDESVAPVISARCLFETLRQLVVMSACDTVFGWVICEKWSDFLCDEGTIGPFGKSQGGSGNKTSVVPSKMSK